MNFSRQSGLYSGGQHRCLSTALGFIIAVFGVTPTIAKTAADTGLSAQARIVEDPPLLKALQTTEKSAGAPKNVYDLHVVYTRGTIWNPATQRNDEVNLRSYQGTGTNPNVPFISPMIATSPGQTLRVTLNNKLPTDSSCSQHGVDVNTPHCFNGTNLHTHGLWINPNGNGDNVLISINPGVNFQYEYNIPPDHPAGTFWYHTHRHGSTALQVSSGMSGALIIRGTRLPTPDTHGDLDTLLKPTDRQPFKERVVVLQQIQYACRNARGTVKTNPDGSYRCDAGDIGGIEGYDALGFSWPVSGRYTSINGHVLPTFKAASTGHIERWRVIHGGISNSINLQFRKLKTGATSPLALPLTIDQQDAYIEANCTGDPLPQHLVAADGLTMNTALKTDVTVFQPGYRWDALMVFPEAGPYCIIDDAAPASANVGKATPSRQLLGVVNVTEGRKVPADISGYLRAELVAAAKVNIPNRTVRGRVVTDLRNDLKLTSFTPHPDITDEEVRNEDEQQLTFDISGIPTAFKIDGYPYDPARIDRVLNLGGVAEWTLKSDLAGHPFHIHVNPFQIVKILDPNGKDVSDPNAVDDADGTIDPQFRGLKGVWKDTLWVKNLSYGTKGQYTLVVRTRYQRYIGDFVLHCHILDHEDLGMMQNIRIALPDGMGGTSLGHH